MAYGDEGTVVAAPVAVAGDVVTVVEAVEAGGHKIDLTEHSSYSKTWCLAYFDPQKYLRNQKFLLWY